MNNIAKRIFIKIGTISLLSVFLFVGFSNQTVLANDDNDLKVEGLNILPDSSEPEDFKEMNDAIQTVGQTGGEVMEHYREEAKKLSTSKQIMTGIMTRDTIMNYLVFVIKFLSQAGLTVGALFIMYAGYQYMTSVISGDKPDNKMITNAIIGILIVIFSYAIMKTLTSIAGLS